MQPYRQIIMGNIQFIAAISKSHATQGVVSYKLLAEAFVAGIKNLDQWKLSMILPF